MQFRTAFIALLTFILESAAYGQAISGAPADAFQVRYASNLAVGDSVINITNAGSQNNNGQLTNICANVYTFSPDEQLVSCCSCAITPNALQSLSVNSDLISNTLTPAHPTSVVVKIMYTWGVSCNASLQPTAAQLAAGGRAWGTTLHALPVTPGTRKMKASICRFEPAISCGNSFRRVWLISVPISGCSVWSATEEARTSTCS